MRPDYTHKPLGGRFPRDLTPHNKRQEHRFRMSWRQILAFLYKEADHLRARSGSLVIQTAHTEREHRLDGKLRADARLAEHPGVVISFDVWNREAKRYEKMQFECDTFFNWQANVRAIAGAMEALRTVDRYDVTSGGRDKAHYEGYKALPAPTGEDSIEEALQFIASRSGFTSESIRNDPGVRKTAIKKTALIVHPDAEGGSHDLFVIFGHHCRMLEKNL